MNETEPRFVSMGEGNCVAHGLSVMRRALGYNSPAPEGYQGQDLADLRQFTNLLPALPGWFPNHRIKLWMSSAAFLITCMAGGVNVMETNIRYAGPVYRQTGHEPEGLCAFGYSRLAEDAEWGTGHFVVGYPARQVGYEVDFVIRVQIAE